MRSPVTFPSRDQLQRPPIARLEHLGILDAHADQIGDVEEAPVVDLLAGDAPVSEPVPLRVEQRVEQR